MKVTLTIKQLKRLIKESTSGIERNLAKVDRAVKKFNEFRKQALAKIGDEGSLYYETGSTLQSGPQYISEMHMEMDGEYVSINYVAEEMAGWNTRRVAQEDRANASDEFEVENLLDSISFLMKGIKKALKYHEKLNPDNEEQALKDLEKDDVDESDDDMQDDTLADTYDADEAMYWLFDNMTKGSPLEKNIYKDFCDWVQANSERYNMVDFMEDWWNSKYFDPALKEKLGTDGIPAWLVDNEDYNSDIGGEWADEQDVYAITGDKLSGTFEKYARANGWFGPNDTGVFGFAAAQLGPEFIKFVDAEKDEYGFAGKPPTPHGRLDERRVTLTFGQLKTLINEEMDKGSFGRTSMDEISRDVRDWYDEHGADLTDEQLNAVVDGTDENSEVFNGMLRDLGLTDADEEVKDAAYQALREEASTELGLYREAADRPWSRVVWDRTDNEMVAQFREECLKRIEDVLEYAGEGHDKWDKAKLWKVIAKNCDLAAKQCRDNSEAVEFRKKRVK